MKAAMFKHICCLSSLPCPLLPSLSLHFPNLCLYKIELGIKLSFSKSPPFPIPATSYIPISAVLCTHNACHKKTTTLHQNVHVCMCVPLCMFYDLILSIQLHFQ